ncbi:protein BatD [Aureimonas fodinaquatilis]|uniref:Protein BatD n=1 Tax=Aureimonas fodinaquatilis TaxID=2565783 RepID=A0A5B0DSE7_9HYPH|nr:BatD family protein [Aureimonas fodinaquatilis]KAA0968915.1 protein BatD [Aureimonas fodinaquatilis]
MRAIWTLLALLTGMSSLAAEPFAKMSVDAGKSIVPGQQIHLVVEVYAPGFFTSPPDFPLFNIAGALVTLPAERAQNTVETVDGAQYSGIARRYAVVPQQSGSFAIPPVHIPFAYSSDGTPTKAEVITAPASFTVEDAGGLMVFSARDLTLTQSFDHDPATLHAGDALVRTITVTAKETQSMLMPPVITGTATGLDQYNQPPTIADGIASGRGETASQRTETMSYIAPHSGQFTLPEIRYAWFDEAAGVSKEATLPATLIGVAPASAQAGIAPATSPNQAGSFEHRRQVALWIGVALAIAGACWWLRTVPTAAMHGLQRVKAHIRSSRWSRLRQVRHAILHKDLPSAYNALHQLAAFSGYQTLKGYVDSENPALAEPVQQLESIVFNQSEEPFDRRRVARLITRPRIANAAVAGTSILPELNPSATQRSPTLH